MTSSLLALGVFLQVVAAPPAPPSPPTTSRIGARQVTPVLYFPEPGMDDTAAYQGYATRLYRDSKANTVQIYLDRRAGREVLLWADALDESAAFTARDASGRAAPVDWDAEAATVGDSGATRSITYRLRAPTRRVTLGWFLLGTMRVERDFQYDKAHLRPFAAAPYVVAPDSLLVANIARLPAGEQGRQLALLRARSVGELRSRLTPSITTHRAGGTWIVRIGRPALDGRSRLALELIGSSREEGARVLGRTVSIRARAWTMYGR